MTEAVKRQLKIEVNILNEYFFVQILIDILMNSDWTWLKLMDTAPNDFDILENLKSKALNRHISFISLFENQCLL